MADDNKKEINYFAPAPEWVKDGRGRDCVAFRGALWYKVSSKKWGGFEAEPCWAWEEIAWEVPYLEYKERVEHFMRTNPR